MISLEQISDYVNSLLDQKNEPSDRLHEYLTQKGHPVVKKDVARFLEQTVMIRQPENILEIGTNVGYSSIVMALKMKNGRIYSVDYRADHHKKALDNFKEFGVEEKIELLTGYAKDILPGLDRKFDLIFIDADKKGYPAYLDYAVSHLKDSGIIIADNLFWKGSVIAPHEFENEKSAVPTLTEFNKRFATLNGFVSQVLSIGDGLGFAVKEDQL